MDSEELVLELEGVAEAVVKQAIRDMWSRNQNVRRDAREWVTEPETEFEDWCEVAGLRADVLQRELKINLEMSSCGSYSQGRIVRL